MFGDPKGPIEHFSWGKFVIYGKEHGKIKIDAKEFIENMRELGG
jgi:hypothetical protein